MYIDFNLNANINLGIYLKVMNKFYQRISEYIKHKKIVSVRQFEIDAKIANGTIGKLEDNPEKGLTTKTLDKIAHQYKDLNIEWLRTGSGKMINGPATQDEKDIVIAQLSEEVKTLKRVLKDLL